MNREIKEKIIEILRKIDNDGFDNIYYEENANQILELFEKEKQEQTKDIREKNEKIDKLNRNPKT